MQVPGVGSVRQASGSGAGGTSNVGVGTGQAAGIHVPLTPIALALMHALPLETIACELLEFTMMPQLDERVELPLATRALFAEGSIT